MNDYMNHLLSAKNYNQLSWSQRFTDYSVKIFDLPLSNEWKKFLFDDIRKNIDCENIDKQLSNLLKSSNGTMDIFPYPNLLFSAFNFTKYDDVKVVIVGQDPYFNFKNVDGKNIPEAMGLSFSIPIEIPIPSSLNNIFNNALQYKHFIKKPNHGNLEFWAYQGCLMLNTALTVQKGEKNSHSNMWKKFTDAIIKKLSDNKKNLVFVLWGAPALKKLSLIDTTKHEVLTSSHPSGLSYNKSLGKYPAFNSIDQFGKINSLLKKNGIKEIIWQL
ncbi:uracil-DNA glycosylase [Catovirus CTV1]|uniref:Uracil-DNA glycosylase n=1 Tax=Catovirus CTV1 TaxID=1977631 RepID=A0A1V0SBD6_9VIRU|nr:uracil-DNA glycosylase [Catovirus CTV1]